MRDKKVDLYKQFQKQIISIANNSISLNSKVSSSNISSLKLKWSIPTDSPISSDPLVYYGNVYFTDWDGYAYCADKQTGKLIWKMKLYSAPSPKNCDLSKLPIPKEILSKYGGVIADVCPPYLWSGFAGTGAIWGNIWYIASVGGKEGAPFSNLAPGRLYAIDIKKGKVIWDKQLTEYEGGGGLAKILVHDGIVYAGISGIDEGAYLISELLNTPYKPNTVGEVVAFDYATGKKIWQTKTVGMLPNDNLQAKGAGVWCSFALCPKLNMLYFGTGNNYGEPESKSSDAIVALDCKTGKLLWQNQVIKGDTWLPEDEEHPDDDFGAGPQLFNITDNKDNIIPVVGIGNKDGYYYVFDRRNGEKVWSAKIYTGKDSGSGIRGNASISKNRVYVWSNNGWDEEEGENPTDFNITVSCLDANTGKKIWSKIQKSAAAIGSGVICNDVYFVGDLLGNIVAYKADDGTVLWTGNIPDGSISSSLVGNDTMVYVGAGVPKAFGGLANSGVYAFGL